MELGAGWVIMKAIKSLHRTNCERWRTLEKLWEKANVKFFWIEGTQMWSKGKLVGLVLPTLMACFT